MTATRLLLDEMLAPRIAEQLGERGVDAVSVSRRADLVHVPDEDVLAFAARERRVLVTLNIGDFAALDAAWRASGRVHAGIVFVAYAAFPPNRGFVGALVRSLARAERLSQLPAPGQTSFLHRSP